MSFIAVNFAGEEELSRIPGVGKALAHVIVAIRENYGNITLETLSSITRRNYTAEELSLLDFTKTRPQNAQHDPISVQSQQTPAAGALKPDPNQSHFDFIDRFEQQVKELPQPPFGSPTVDPVEEVDGFAERINELERELRETSMLLSENRQSRPATGYRWASLRSGINPVQTGGQYHQERDVRSTAKLVKDEPMRGRTPSPNFRIGSMVAPDFRRNSTAQRNSNRKFDCSEESDEDLPPRGLKQLPRNLTYDGKGS